MIITPRVVLVIIGIVIMLVSAIPLLREVDITISGFSIAEKIQESRLPQSSTFYLIAIFILALIAVIYGFHSRRYIVH